MTPYDKTDKTTYKETKTEPAQMPKSPPPKRRRAPTSAENPPVVEMGSESFGRRLRQLLDQKGMNYSDLARLVWGKITTKDGYEVAKNRDRISVYVSGKAFPDARNLKKIADHLGVEVADLAPDRVGDAMLEHQHPAYSITKTGEGDRVFLRVNKLVSEEVAAKIILLLVPHHGDAERANSPPPPRITRLGKDQDDDELFHVP